MFHGDCIYLHMRCRFHCNGRNLTSSVVLLPFFNHIQIFLQTQFTVPPSRHTVVMAENHQKYNQHQGQYNDCHNAQLARLVWYFAHGHSSLGPVAMSYTPDLNTIKANQTDRYGYNRYQSYACALGAHVPHKRVQITTVTFLFKFPGTKK